MIRRPPRRTGADDPGQLSIDWNAEQDRTPSEPAKAATTVARPVSALVQRLPWDFKTSFPQPTDEAIDNGLLDETDRVPENLKSLHDNYARECLTTLAALDKVSEARRKGIDPGTGNKPRTHAARERLLKYLAEEPPRLEHTFEVLIETYEESFGSEAANAFRKAITARHASIEVVAEQPGKSPDSSPVRQLRRSHASSALPVPRPLRSSVASGIFGHDESGKPSRPSAEEVRAITEDQAERMIEMDDTQLETAVSKYAEDFGSKAAGQLERYVRRQQRSR